MGRPAKDPVLAKLKVTGDYEAYLRIFGMPSELPPSADLNELDLPSDPETGRKIDLEAFAGALYSGHVKVNGVHRKTEGGAVANYSGLEHEPSEEWTRSASFLKVIACILLCRRNNSRQQRRDLKELRECVTDLPPTVDLPRFPADWGTPEEFYENWRSGYIDIAVRYKNRSRKGKEIQIYSTGLREFEQSCPEEPDDFDPATEPEGYWEGLKWTGGPRRS
jgi:hypothetical protein